MVSTMITRGTSEEREREALALCQKYKIHQYDKQIFSPILIEEKGSNDEKFGVSMVRKIKQRAILKPVYSKQNAIIILEAQLLTLPAQQALLKLLEEPPLHTIIIMTVDKEESLLPTICSRCQIIRLVDIFQNQEKENEGVDKLLKEDTVTIGERLELAESVSQNRPEEWVKEYIINARLRMLQAVENNNMSFLKRISESLVTAQKAYQMLTTTNGNQRLIVEHLLLSIQ